MIGGAGHLCCWTVESYMPTGLCSHCRTRKSLTFPGAPDWEPLPDQASSQLWGWLASPSQTHRSSRTELFIFNPKLRFTSAVEENLLVCAITLTHHCSRTAALGGDRVTPWTWAGLPARPGWSLSEVWRLGSWHSTRVRIRNGQAATPGSGGWIVPICSGCFLFLSAGSAALTRWAYPVVYGARQGFLFLLS